ncbi:MAG: phage head spike fiber domain-containing protein, partial [Pseudomonas sp.]
MIGMGMSLTRSPDAGMWWPAAATWAADFIGDRYMRAGSPVPRTSALSFARAGTKFARRADGRLVSFEADVPARTDLGLLLEPAATNLFTASADQTDTSWVRNGCSATSGHPDPTGNVAATFIVEHDGGALLRRHTDLAVTVGQTYTVSCYVARTSVDWFRLIIGDGSSFSNAAHAWFNLAAATQGSSGSGGSGYGYVTHGCRAEGQFLNLSMTVIAPANNL